MAIDFLDQGDPDSAVSLLEETLSQKEEPQLRQLLTEITAPTPLTLTYSTDDESAIVIHSLSAEESYQKQVRFTLEYTAPEGLLLQIRGKTIPCHHPEVLTSGQNSRLSFEMDAADLQKLNDQLQVLFSTPTDQVHTLDIHVHRTEEKTSQPLSVYEINYLMMDHNRTENAQVTSFQIADRDNSYHFTVEYTAIAGLTITGLLETTDTTLFFWDQPLITEGGAGILEFDIEKELFSAGKYMEVCFTAENGQWVAAGFDFPMMFRRTLAETQTEPYHPTYALSSTWQSGKCTLHDCYSQTLDNGYTRFTLDLTASSSSFVSVFANSGSADKMLSQFMTSGERQQFVFDVSNATLASAKSLSVLVAAPRSRGQYFEIPTAPYAACTDSKPVADPIALEFFIIEQPRNRDFQVLGGTVQPLENGCFRYCLEIFAEDAMRCSIFDPPNGDAISWLYLTNGENPTSAFSFDVPAVIASKLTEITFSGSCSSGTPLSAVFKNPSLPMPEPIQIHVIN